MPAPPDSRRLEIDAAASPAKKRGTAAWLGDLLVVVLVLLPALGAGMLVNEYVVNAPHYDDFTFASDWLK